jgi:large subunit ribosomal protein L1
MAKISRRTKAFSKIQGSAKTALGGYSLQDAVAKIQEFPAVKFDETLEMHFALNLKTNATDQVVRGTVVLPHGTGKRIRIVVICKGETARKAEELGADHVGANELIEKIAGGFLDFDCIIASPDMMRDLSKLGRILGPRGLMPSPKAGTVTADVERAVKEIRAGRIEFKADKQNGIHLGIGKRSFDTDKLVENARVVLEAVEHARPSSVKGQLVKSLAISTTMGPGIRVTV